MTKHDFIQDFGHFEPPQALLQLFDFHTQANNRHLLSGFTFEPAQATQLLRSYCNQPRFLDALLLFGICQPSQSGYALWTHANQLTNQLLTINL